MAAGYGERYDVYGLTEGFHDQDMAALAQLTARERAGQLDIRQRLWRYTDQMWDQAKLQADNPAQDPRYSAIAVMRDLLAELRANAGDAVAGDRD